MIKRNPLTLRPTAPLIGQWSIRKPVSIRQVHNIDARVDMVTSGQLSDAIGVAAAQAPVGIVVDLSKTDFLASTGMSVLIQAHTEVTSTGQFGIVADGPATSRPMKLLGLDKVLGLYRTLGEALAEMNSE